MKRITNDDIVKKAGLSTLVAPEDLRRRVAEIGQEAAAAFPPDDEVLCVCVLKGGVMFFAELMKHFPHGGAVFGFMRLSSYGDERESGGSVRLVHDLSEKIEGRHVLIVEDIVDTGRTLRFLFDYFQGRGALSVRAAALVDKPDKREMPVTADYTAFQLKGDPFVVGFGLDDAQKFRALDGLYEVQPK